MRSERARLRTAITLALLGAATSGCADFRRGDYWDEAGTGGTEDGTGGTLGYTADVHPLLVAGCDRCHGPGQSASGTDFGILADDPAATLEIVLTVVDLEVPSESRVLSKMAGSGHGGGTIYDDRSGEYDTVLAWIEQGAAP